ncbi:hypothetical protein NPIL_650071 [Nephila pilipes]|uniref:Uncharacterized protein n=1 Tax=Nephila pilipes TaxID=299642 RepID=A0A8X6TUD9_NEPPI|nr:hypothetical protein NPIL_650071 [Nephila pilipes]
MLYWQLTPQNKIPHELHGYESRLPRELHNRNCVNDMIREDKLNLLKMSRVEAANSVHATHLANKHRFELHQRSHLFKSELSCYTAG